MRQLGASSERLCSTKITKIWPRNASFPSTTLSKVYVRSDGRDLSFYPTDTMWSRPIARPLRYSSQLYRLEAHNLHDQPLPIVSRQYPERKAQDRCKPSKSLSLSTRNSGALSALATFSPFGLRHSHLGGLDVGSVVPLLRCRALTGIFLALLSTENEICRRDSDWSLSSTKVYTNLRGN